jgi:DNA-binding IclR family transcriptional regulator
MTRAAKSNAATPAGFTFLTNHAHILLLIARQPNARMREMALQVGITERAVQRIVDELAAAGYLRVTREGRRNRYQLQVDLPLRHTVEAHCTIGELIEFVNRD